MDTQSDYKTAWGKIWDSAAWGDKMIKRQQDQRVTRQRMTRQTHIMRDRFVDYGEKFLQVFGLLSKKRKATANPIPAPLRPWVPHNRNCSPSDAYRLLFKLRGVCTREQYKELEQRYNFLWQRAGVTEW